MHWADYEQFMLSEDERDDRLRSSRRLRRQAAVTQDGTNGSDAPGAPATPSPAPRPSIWDYDLITCGTLLFLTLLLIVVTLCLIYELHNAEKELTLCRRIVDACAQNLCPSEDSSVAPRLQCRAPTPPSETSWQPL